MGLMSWLREFSTEKSWKNLTSAEKECFRLASQLKMYQYAQSIIAEIYGGMLSKCDFLTFVKNEQKQGDNWYRLNVEPNPNQSSSEFMKQLVNRLIFRGEALIVQTDDGNLYVASDFQKNDKQLVRTYFTNVWVDIYEDGSVAPYQLQGTFKQDRSIYIKYVNENALQLISNMNTMFQDLIDNVKRSGSSNLKYALGIDATALNGVSGLDINKEITRITNEDFNALVSDKNAIIPLFNGFDLKVLNPSNNNAQNSTTASANINTMFDNVLRNVARIYNIPASFILGTDEKNDLEHFLTFGLDPLATLISEGFNRNYYGKRQILDGTYCRLDTKKVKHFDMLSVSDAINKLISSGVYSINEVRGVLEEQPIDKQIGDVHWVTRNYAVIGDYLQEQSNYTANDPKTHNGGNNEQRNDIQE